MKTPRTKKMLKKQREAMVNFMFNHRHLALKNFEEPSGKVTEDNKWMELGFLLDLHGPPKTTLQWKKAWTDLKNKTKAKNERILAERSVTGNISRSTPPLNESERKVLTIIGLGTSTPTIDTEAPEYAVMVGSPITVQEEDFEEASSAVPLPVSPPKRGRVTRTPRTPSRAGSSRIEEAHCQLEAPEAWQRELLESIRDRLVEYGTNQVTSLGKRTSLNEDRLAVEKEMLAVEKERLSVEKERLAMEKERLAMEKERLALERPRCHCPQGAKEMLEEMQGQLKKMANALTLGLPKFKTLPSGAS